MKKILLISFINFIFFYSNIFSNTLSFLHDISIKNMAGSNNLSPFINDAFAPFSNPAALGNTERQNIKIMYHNLFENTFLTAISYAHPFFEKGTLSTSFVLLNSSDIKVINEYNETINTFNDSFKTIYLSYGINLSFINLGINAKYLNHDFFETNVTGYGIDSGLLVYLPFNFILSGSIENLIKPKFKYTETEKDILPLFYNLSLGTSFSIFKNLKDTLKVGASLGKEELSSNINYGVGIEYDIFSILSIFLGTSTENIFSSGVSFKFNNIEINYAYINTQLDFLHKFSIGYYWGENIRKLEKDLKTKEEKIKYALIKKIKTETINKFKNKVNKLLDNKEYEKALEEVTKALIWDPDNKWFLNKEKQLNNLVKKEKVKMYLQQADSLIKKEKYIDALVILRKTLDIDPNNKLALYKLNKTKEILKSISNKNLEIEAKNKYLIKKHFEKGLNYYSMGEFKKAINEWSKVIKSSPLQRQIYKYIQNAETKLRKKEEKKVKEKIKKISKINSLYNKAVMLYTKGDFEESIKVWQQILKLDPKNKEAKEYIQKITKEYMEIQKQRLKW